MEQHPTCETESHGFLDVHFSGFHPMKMKIEILVWQMLIGLGYILVSICIYATSEMKKKEKRITHRSESVTHISKVRAFV